MWRGKSLSIGRLHLLVNISVLQVLLSWMMDFRLGTSRERDGDVGLFSSAGRNTSSVQMTVKLLSSYDDLIGRGNRMPTRFTDLLNRSLCLYRCFGIPTTGPMD